MSSCVPLISGVTPTSVIEASCSSVSAPFPSSATGTYSMDTPASAAMAWIDSPSSASTDVAASST